MAQRRLTLDDVALEDQNPQGNANVAPKTKERHENIVLASPIFSEDASSRPFGDEWRVADLPSLELPIEQRDEVHAIIWKVISGLLKLKSRTLTLSRLHASRWLVSMGSRSSTQHQLLQSQSQRTRHPQSGLLPLPLSPVTTSAHS